MNEDMPSRLYNLHFLNADLQREQTDHLLVKDVRIGPSGAIEYTRVFMDSDSTYKGFYNGVYLIEEVSEEELEEMKNHHHDHEGEE